MRAVSITLFSLLVGFLTIDGYNELSVVFPEDSGFVIGSSGLLALYWIFEIIEVLILQAQKIKPLIWMPILWLNAMAQCSTHFHSFKAVAPIAITLLLAYIGEQLIVKAKLLANKAFKKKRNG